LVQTVTLTKVRSLGLRGTLSEAQMARALLLLALAAGASALYSSSDAVVQLTDKDFDKKTREGVWLVEVYADW